MKILHVEKRVGLGEMVWEKRKEGWWINGMGGMVVLALLRFYGWWWRVPTTGQAQELLQHQNILQFWLLLWRSNLWEVKILSHVSWGVFSWKYHFPQQPHFLLQSCFHGTFPSGRALLPPQLSRDWRVFTGFLSQSFDHRVFIAGFLSQGFFHSGQSHSRNCDQEGGFYFSFMPEGRSWKMLKNGLSTILAIFNSQN